MRESEPVGPVDDDGICRRNIQTGCYDGGANKTVVITPDKFCHRILNIGALHPAVDNPDSGFRNKFFNQPGHGVYGLHPVMEKKYLAVSVDFLPDRVSYNVFAEFEYRGLHGKPVFRSGVDDGQIADADE